MGLAILLRRKLREAGNERRASEAAMLAHRAFDLSLSRNPSDVALACKRGCSYCCHTFVSVFAPEVFRAASWLRTHRPQVVERLIELTGATANLDLDQRHGAHLPCPLLQENECSIYSERPLVCRKAVSPSVDACRVEFDGGSIGIQMPYVHISFSNDVNLALQIALRSAGLPDVSYEFSAALRAALANPDSERDWLCGHNIFDGVYQEQRPADLDSMVSALTRQLAEVA
jgi:hypothetical protein